MRGNKGKKKVIFTDKQKLDACLLAEKTSVLQASRETGISERNIIRWRKDYKVIEKTAQEMEEASHKLVPTSEERLAQYDTDYIEKTKEYRIRFLEKLWDSVENTNGRPEYIHSIAGALKILHDTLGSNENQAAQGGNVYQQVNNYYDTPVV